MSDERTTDAPRTRAELLREVRFYGELARRFGDRHEIVGRTLPELVLGLDEQRDGALRRYLYDADEKQKVGFRVWIDGEEVPEDRVRVLLPDDARSIEIMPYPLAAKGALQIIIGVLLIAIGVVLIILFGWTGIGGYIGMVLISTGVSLLASGIATLVAPTPRLSGSGDQGFGFSGGVRILGQGEPRPILWGRAWASGGAISAGSRAIEEDEKHSEFFKNAERRIIDLVSEGEIEGWVYPDEPDKCIALDDTLVSELFEMPTDTRTDKEKKRDDAPLFSAATVAWELKRGDLAQTPVSFVPAPEFEGQVGIEMLQSKPITRSTTPGSHLAAIRINLLILGLNRQGSDSHAQDLAFTITVVDTGGSGWQDTLARFWDRKVQQQRNLTYEMKVQGVGPWDITIVKTSKDTEGTAQRSCYWQSFTEVSSAQLRYPGSAMVAMKWRASEFSGSPNRLYLLNGVKCRVPSNYDAAARTYTTPHWNGTFKAAREFTENPVWQACEYLTNRQFGTGTHIDDDAINWQSAYQAARRCDEMVDDLRGGTEPRHSFGAHDIRGGEAWRKIMDHLAAAFVVPYYDGFRIGFIQDRPGTRRDVVTPEMVVDGRFEYTGTPLATMLNRVSVRYASEEDLDRDSVEVVEDPDSIRKFGLHQRDLSATGLRSRSEAIRLLWNAILADKLQGEAIAFRMGPHAESYRPGEVIGVMDPNRGGERFTGLLVHASSASVDLDNAVELKPGVAYKFYCAQPVVSKVYSITGVDGVTFVLDYPLLGGDPADTQAGLEAITVRQDVDLDGVYEVERRAVAYTHATRTVRLDAGNGVATAYPTLVEYHLPMYEGTVTNIPSTTAKVTLSPAFSLPPEPQFAWAIAEQSQEIVDWRVLGLERKNDTNEYDVTAIRYAAEKYPLIDALPAIPVIDDELLPVPALGSIVPPPSGVTVKIEARQVGGVPTPVLVVTWGEPDWTSPNFHAVMGYEVRVSRDGELPWVLEELSTDRESTLDNPQLGNWQAWVRSIDVERRKSRPEWDAFVYDDTSDVRAVGEIIGLRIDGSADGVTSEGSAFEFVWDYRQPGAIEQGDVASAPSGVSTFIVEVHDLSGGGMLRRVEVGLSQRYVYGIDENRADQAKLGRASPKRTIRLRVWARGVTGEDGDFVDLIVSNPARPAPDWWFGATPGDTATGQYGVLHAEVTSTGEVTPPADARGIAMWASTDPNFTPGPANCREHVTGRHIASPATSNTVHYAYIAQLDVFDGDAHEIADPASQLNLSGIKSTEIFDPTGQGNWFGSYPIVHADIEIGAVEETNILDGSISTPKIHTNGLDAQVIKTGFLDANRIEVGSLLGDRIAANTLDADRIKANTITALQIFAKGITTETLAIGSVVTDRIGANAVTEFDSFDVALGSPVTVNVNGSGGKISMVLSADGRFDQGDPVTRFLQVTCIRNISAYEAVIYYNGSAYVDYTLAAQGAGSVPLPNVLGGNSPTDVALYLSMPYQLGNGQAGFGQGPAISVTVDAPFAGGTSAFQLQYWNGISGLWTMFPTYWDQTNGGEQNGLIYWAGTAPAGWQRCQIPGSLNSFWVRIIQTQNPDPAPATATAATIMQASHTVAQAYNSNGNTGDPQALAAIGMGKIIGTKPVESLTFYFDYEVTKALPTPTAHALVLVGKDSAH